MGGYLELPFSCTRKPLILWAADKFFAAMALALYMGNWFANYQPRSRYQFLGAKETGFAAGVAEEFKA